MSIIQANSAVIDATLCNSSCESALFVNEYVRWVLRKTQTCSLNHRKHLKMVTMRDCVPLHHKMGLYNSRFFSS